MDVQVIEIKEGRKQSSDIFEDFMVVGGVQPVWLGKSLVTVVIDLDSQYYTVCSDGSFLHLFIDNVKEFKP